MPEEIVIPNNNTPVEKGPDFGDLILNGKDLTQIDKEYRENVSPIDTKENYIKKYNIKDAALQKQFSDTYDKEIVPLYDTYKKGEFIKDHSKTSGWDADKYFNRDVIHPLPEYNKIGFMYPTINGPVPTMTEDEYADESGKYINQSGKEEKLDYLTKWQKNLVIDHNENTGDPYYRELKDGTIEPGMQYASVFGTQEQNGGYAVNGLKTVLSSFMGYIGSQAVTAKAATANKVNIGNDFYNWTKKLQPPVTQDFQQNPDGLQYIVGATAGMAGFIAATAFELKVMKKAGISPKVSQDINMALMTASFAGTGYEAAKAAGLNDTDATIIWAATLAPAAGLNYLLAPQLTRLLSNNETKSEITNWMKSQISKEDFKSIFIPANAGSQASKSKLNDFSKRLMNFVGNLDKTKSIAVKEMLVQPAKMATELAGYEGAVGGIEMLYDNFNDSQFYKDYVYDPENPSKDYETDFHNIGERIKETWGHAFIGAAGVGGFMGAMKYYKQDPKIIQQRKDNFLSDQVVQGKSGDIIKEINRVEKKSGFAPNHLDTDGNIITAENKGKVASMNSFMANRLRDQVNSYSDLYVQSGLDKIRKSWDNNPKFKNNKDQLDKYFANQLKEIVNPDNLAKESLKLIKQKYDLEQSLEKTPEAQRPDVQIKIDELTKQIDYYKSGKQANDILKAGLVKNYQIDERDTGIFGIANPKITNTNLDNFNNNITVESERLKSEATEFNKAKQEKLTSDEGLDVSIQAALKKYALPELLSSPEFKTLAESITQAGKFGISETTKTGIGESIKSKIDTEIKTLDSDLSSDSSTIFNSLPESEVNRTSQLQDIITGELSKPKDQQDISIIDKAKVYLKRAEDISNLSEHASSLGKTSVIPDKIYNKQEVINKSYLSDNNGINYEKITSDFEKSKEVLSSEEDLKRLKETISDIEAKKKLFILNKNVYGELNPEISGQTPENTLSDKEYQNSKILDDLNNLQNRLLTVYQESDAMIQRQREFKEINHKSDHLFTFNMFNNAIFDNLGDILHETKDKYIKDLYDEISGDIDNFRESYHTKDSINADSKDKKNALIETQNSLLSKLYLLQSYLHDVLNRDKKQSDKIFNILSQGIFASKGNTVLNAPSFDISYNNYYLFNNIVNPEIGSPAEKVRYNMFVNYYNTISRLRTSDFVNAFNGYVTKIKDSDNIPSFEQQQTIQHAVAFLHDSDNHFKLKKDSKLELIENALFLQGFAGSGKSSAVLQAITGIHDSLSKSDKKVVLSAKANSNLEVITKSVGKSIDSDKITSISLHNLINDKTNLSKVLKDISYIVIDEASLLTDQDINKLRKITNDKIPVIYLGDASQLSGNLKHEAPAISYETEKSNPVTQVFRTDNHDINSVQQTYRDASLNRMATPKYLPTKYKEDGSQGVRYRVSNEKENQINDFKNDILNKKQAVFIVTNNYERDLLISELKPQDIDVSDNVKTIITEGEGDKVNFSAQGLQYNRVYVNLDKNKLDVNYNKAQLTAASRAIKYLDIMTDADNANPPVSVKVKELLGETQEQGAKRTQEQQEYKELRAKEISDNNDYILNNDNNKVELKPEKVKKEAKEKKDKPKESEVLNSYTHPDSGEEIHIGDAIQYGNRTLRVTNITSDIDGIHVTAEKGGKEYDVNIKLFNKIQPKDINNVFTGDVSQTSFRRAIRWNKENKQSASTVYTTQEGGYDFNNKHHEFKNEVLQSIYSKDGTFPDGSFVTKFYKEKVSHHQDSNKLKKYYNVVTIELDTTNNAIKKIISDFLTFHSIDQSKLEDFAIMGNDNIPDNMRDFDFTKHLDKTSEQILDMLGTKEQKIGTDHYNYEKYKVQLRLDALKNILPGDNQIVIGKVNNLTATPGSIAKFTEKFITVTDLKEKSKNKGLRFGNVIQLHSDPRDLSNSKFQTGLYLQFSYDGNFNVSGNYNVVKLRSQEVPVDSFISRIYAHINNRKDSINKQDIWFHINEFIKHNINTFADVKEGKITFRNKEFSEVLDVSKGENKKYGGDITNLKLIVPKNKSGVIFSELINNIAKLKQGLEKLPKGTPVLRDELLLAKTGDESGRIYKLKDALDESKLEVNVDQINMPILVWDKVTAESKQKTSFQDKSSESNFKNERLELKPTDYNKLKIKTRSEESARKLITNILGDSVADTKLKFKPEVFSSNNLAAFGRVINSVIEIESIDGRVKSTNPRHEVMHFVLNELLDEPSKNHLLSEMKSDISNKTKIKDITDEFAEEQLANYYSKRYEGVSGTIRKFVDWLHSFISNGKLYKSDIDNFISRVESGDFKDVYDHVEDGGVSYERLELKDDNKENPEDIKDYTKLINVFGSEHFTGIRKNIMLNVLNKSKLNRNELQSNDSVINAIGQVYDNIVKSSDDIVNSKRLYLVDRNGQDTTVTVDKLTFDDINKPNVSQDTIYDYQDYNLSNKDNYLLFVKSIFDKYRIENNKNINKISDYEFKKDENNDYLSEENSSEELQNLIDNQRSWTENSHKNPIKSHSQEIKFIMNSITYNEYDKDGELVNETGRHLHEPLVQRVMYDTSKGAIANRINKAHQKGMNQIDKWADNILLEAEAFPGSVKSNTLLSIYDALFNKSGEIGEKGLYSYKYLADNYNEIVDNYRINKKEIILTNGDRLSIDEFHNHLKQKSKQSSEVLSALFSQYTSVDSKSHVFINVDKNKKFTSYKSSSQVADVIKNEFNNDFVSALVTTVDGQNILKDNVKRQLFDTYHIEYNVLNNKGDVIDVKRKDVLVSERDELLKQEKQGKIKISELAGKKFTVNENKSGYRFKSEGIYVLKTIGQNKVVEQMLISNNGKNTFGYTENLTKEEVRSIFDFFGLKKISGSTIDVFFNEKDKSIIENITNNKFTPGGINKNKLAKIIGEWFFTVTNTGTAGAEDITKILSSDKSEYTDAISEEGVDSDRTINLPTSAFNLNRDLAIVESYSRGSDTVQFDYFNGNPYYKHTPRSYTSGLLGHNDKYNNNNTNPALNFENKIQEQLGIDNDQRRLFSDEQLLLKAKENNLTPFINDNGKILNPLLDKNQSDNVITGYGINPGLTKGLQNVEFSKLRPIEYINTSLNALFIDKLLHDKNLNDYSIITSTSSDKSGVPIVDFQKSGNSKVINIREGVAEVNYDYFVSRVNDRFDIERNKFNNSLTRIVNGINNVFSARNDKGELLFPVSEQDLLRIDNVLKSMSSMEPRQGDRLLTTTLQDMFDKNINSLPKEKFDDIISQVQYSDMRLNEDYKIISDKDGNKRLVLGNSAEMKFLDKSGKNFEDIFSIDNYHEFKEARNRDIINNTKHESINALKDLFSDKLSDFTDFIDNYNYKLPKEAEKYGDVVNRYDADETQLLKDYNTYPRYENRSRINRSVKYNPLVEAFYLTTFFDLYDVNNMTIGHTSQFSDIVDFYKRASGQISPGSMIDISNPYGLKKKSLVAIVRDDDHRYSDKLAKDKAATDGFIVENPLHAYGIYISQGGSNGAFKEWMSPAKTLYFDNDILTGESTQFKSSKGKISNDMLSRSQWAEEAIKRMLGGEAIDELSFNDPQTGQLTNLYNKYIEFKGDIPKLWEYVSENNLHDKYIAQYVHASTVKQNLYGINDHYNTTRPLKLREINNQNEVIQLNPHKDLESSDASMHSQILNEQMIGLNNRGRADKIQDALAKIVYINLDKITAEISKTGIEQYLRNLGKSSSGSQKSIGQFLKAITNPDVTINIQYIQDKLKPLMVSEINKIIKPHFSGIDNVQNPGHIIDVFEATQDSEHFQAGIKYSLNNLKARSVDIKDIDKYGLKHTIMSDMEATQDGITPLDAAMPFKNYDKFGFNNQPNDKLNYRNWDVDDILGLVFEDGSKTIRYDSLGKTPEERKTKLNSLIGEGNLPDSISNYAIQATKGDENYKVTKEDLSNYLENFLLNIQPFLQRTPASTTAAGSKAKIFTFINDQGNTGYFPPQKNLRDGTDYDVDIQTSYFYEHDKEGNVSFDENTEVGLKNIVIRESKDYYNDVNNSKLIFTPVSTSKIDNIIDNISAKADDLLKRANYPGDVTSSIKSFINNMAGKNTVGITALGIKAYSNIYNAYAKDNYDGKHFSLIFNGKEYNSYTKSLSGQDAINEAGDNVISFLAELLQGGVDNSKLLILDKINANESTMGMISSLVIAGAEPKAIIDFMTDKTVTDVINKAINSKAVTETTQDISKVLENKYASDNKIFEEYNKLKTEADKAQFLSKNKQSFGVQSEAIPGTEESVNTYDFSSFEENIKNSISKLSQLRDVYDFSEGINKMSQILNINQGIKINDFGIEKYIDNLEYCINQKLEDFLSDKPITDTDYYKTKNKYLEQRPTETKNKAEVISDYDRFYRTDKKMRESLDFRMVIKNNPNVLSYIKALAFVKNQFKEAFLTNSELLKTKEQEIVNSLNEDRFVHENEKKAHTGELNNFLVVKYITQEYKGKNMTLDHDTDSNPIGNLDISNVQDRNMFVAKFPDYIEYLQRNNPNNKFLSKLLIKSQTVSNNKYVIIDSQYMTDMDKLTMEQYASVLDNIEPGITEKLYIYDIIKNGFATHKGSYVGFLPVSLFKGYTDFVNKLHSDIKAGRPNDLSVDIDNSFKDNLMGNRKDLVPFVPKEGNPFEGDYTMGVLTNEQGIPLFIINVKGKKVDAPDYTLIPDTKSKPLSEYPDYVRKYMYNPKGRLTEYVFKLDRDKGIYYREQLKASRRSGNYIPENTTRGEVFNLPDEAIIKLNETPLKSVSIAIKSGLKYGNNWQNVYFRNGKLGQIRLEQGGKSIEARYLQQPKTNTLYAVPGVLSEVGRFYSEKTLDIILDKLKKAYPNIKTFKYSASESRALGKIQDREGVLQAGFNRDNQRLDVPVHEYQHINSIILRSENRPLYDFLLKEAMKYEDIVKTVKNNYPEEQVNDEMVSTMIGLASVEKAKEFSNKPQDLFDRTREVFNKVWEWIRDNVWSKIFGLDKPILSEMKVEDFANMSGMDIFKYISDKMLEGKVFSNITNLELSKLTDAENAINTSLEAKEFELNNIDDINSDITGYNKKEIEDNNIERVKNTIYNTVTSSAILNRNEGRYIYEANGKKYEISNPSDKAELASVASKVVSERNNYEKTLRDNIHDYFITKDINYLPKQDQKYSDFIESNIRIRPGDRILKYSDLKSEMGGTLHDDLFNTSNFDPIVIIHKSDIGKEINISIHDVTSEYLNSRQGLELEYISKYISKSERSKNNVNQEARGLAKTNSGIKKFNLLLAAISMKAKNPDIRINTLGVHGFNETNSDYAMIHDYLSEVKMIMTNPDFYNKLNDNVKAIINTKDIFENNSYKQNYFENLLNFYINEKENLYQTIEGKTEGTEESKLANTYGYLERNLNKYHIENDIFSRDVERIIKNRQKDIIKKYQGDENLINNDNEYIELSKSLVYVQKSGNVKYTNSVDISDVHKMVGQNYDLAHPIAQWFVTKMKQAFDKVGNLYHSVFKDTFDKLLDKIPKQNIFKERFTVKGWQMFDPLFVRESVKDEDGNIHEADVYEIMYKYIDKSGVERMHYKAAEALKNGTISEDYLELGGFIVKTIKDLMIEDRMNKGDDLKKANQWYQDKWKDGMIPIMSKSAGEKIFSGNIKEGLKQWSTRYSNSNDMYDYLADSNNSPYEISDRFDSQSGGGILGSTTRQELMGLKLVDGFIVLTDKSKNENISKNLEHLMSYFVMNKMLKAHMNDIMPEYYAAKNILHNYEGSKGKGKEFSNYIQYLNDMTRMIVFGEKKDDKFAKKFLGVNVTDIMNNMGAVTVTGAIAGNLSLSLSNFLTNGVNMANFVFSAPGGSFFGKKEALQAIVEMTKNPSIVMKLMNTYRLADMDVKDIINSPRFQKTDRSFGSHHVHWLNFIGDYSFRALSLVAQMIKDGSWDAHSLDAEGNLIYNESKDKQYEGADGKLLRDYRAKKLVDEGAMIKESDLLPRTYDSEFKNTIKNISDKFITGAFDAESRVNLEKNIMGKALNMFHKYVWSKRSLLTSEGHISQAFSFPKIVEIVDDNGKTKREVIMQGTYMEGMLQSVMGLAREIKDMPDYSFEELTKIWNDADPMRRMNIKRLRNDIFMIAVLMTTGTVLASDDDEKDKERKKRLRDLQNSRYYRAIKNSFSDMAYEVNPYSWIKLAESPLAMVRQIKFMADFTTDMLKGDLHSAGIDIKKAYGFIGTGAEAIEALTPDEDKNVKKKHKKQVVTE